MERREWIHTEKSITLSIEESLWAKSVLGENKFLFHPKRENTRRKETEMSEPEKCDGDCECYRHNYFEDGWLMGIFSPEAIEKYGAPKDSRCVECKKDDFYPSDNCQCMHCKMYFSGECFASIRKSTDPLSKPRRPTVIPEKPSNEEIERRTLALFQEAIDEGLIVENDSSDEELESQCDCVDPDDDENMCQKCKDQDEIEAYAYEEWGKELERRRKEKLNSESMDKPKSVTKPNTLRTDDGVTETITAKPNTLRTDDYVPKPLTKEQIEALEKQKATKQILYKTDAPEKERLKTLRELGKIHGRDPILGSLSKTFSELIIKPDSFSKTNANIILHDILIYYQQDIQFQRDMTDEVSRNYEVFNSSEK